VSITYGAGGSTRKRTHDTIKKFTYRPSIKPIPHLTCVGDTKDSIRKLAINYWKMGIKSIVVIRGDPENIKLSKKRKFINFPNGYTYASELIKDLKRAVKIPVIGNGDVVSVGDYIRIKQETDCDAVMIGRAALGNPWIFKSIYELESGKPEYAQKLSERISMCRRHFQLLQEDKNDYICVNLAKKHFSY